MSVAISREFGVLILSAVQLFVVTQHNSSENASSSLCLYFSQFMHEERVNPQ